MKERRQVIIMDLGETKSCNKGKLIRVSYEQSSAENKSRVAK